MDEPNPIPIWISALFRIEEFISQKPCRTWTKYQRTFKMAK